MYPRVLCPCFLYFGLIREAYESSLETEVFLSFIDGNSYYQRLEQVGASF